MILVNSNLLAFFLIGTIVGKLDRTKFFVSTSMSFLVGSLAGAVATGGVGQFTRVSVPSKPSTEGVLWILKSVTNEVRFHLPSPSVHSDLTLQDRATP